MVRKINRLARETSPYLKQHAHNPVDWFPWGQEALGKAKREAKPIFLSIGYSACHWCHVMEKESFENLEVADFLNQHFVSIKVDREERPDLDHVYMKAVQLMNQQGGWPLTVFLTPDLKPFYGGTYFPPVDRYGMPSFLKVLQGIQQFWTTKNEELVQNSHELINALNEDALFSVPNAFSFETLRSRACELIEKSVDVEHGGLGKAPKFFHTPELKLLWQEAIAKQNTTYKDLVQVTLEKIACGGIYDHLGGGFHRYSTDSKWFAPHFEKMLYDNALVAELYLEAFRATQEPAYAYVVKETLYFCLTELRQKSQAFYSTLDADSEGEEGRFYTWTFEELKSILGADSFLMKWVTENFHVSRSGNWEHGRNILYLNSFLSKEEDIHERAVAKRKLLRQREQRPKPHLDQKVLASWNAMMIHTLCLAYETFEEGDFLTAAKEAYHTVLETLVIQQNGQWDIKHCLPNQPGFLEDYAFLLNVSLSLHEATLETSFLENAKQIATSLLHYFLDKEKGILYFAKADNTDLIFRPIDIFDGATPSATNMAVYALARLNLLVPELGLHESIEKILRHLTRVCEHHPAGFAQLLLAWQYLKPTATRVEIESNSTDEEWVIELLSQLRKLPFTSKVVTFRKTDKQVVKLCHPQNCFFHIDISKDSEWKEKLLNEIRKNSS